MEKISFFVTDGGLNCVHIEDIDCFSVFKTFDCGQCFRFEPVLGFPHKYAVGGVAMGRYAVFAQDNENELYIYNSTEEDYYSLWRTYLSLDIDYRHLNEKISTVKSDYMKKATEYSHGIRILRQDPWEAVCSFIISQNNNIPRIKKIITALCEKYGESVALLGKSYYSFPSAEAVLSVGEDGMRELKTGFRAGYIIDAAKSIINGSVSIEYLNAENDFDLCVKHLCSVKGIGPKVACCALLFGFGKTEAFPVDVWIKRVLEENFKEGIDLKYLGKSAGLAQQYMFYYERYYNSMSKE